jgi:hypothetical protein
MIDDALVLRVERLRDSAEELRLELKSRYKSAKRPVVAPSTRESAAQLGERWLVEVSARDDVLAAVGHDVAAELNVEFQRLITFADRLTTRERYDTALKAILKDFRTDVVIPLKQARNRGFMPAAVTGHPSKATARTAFVGHSFIAGDKAVTTAVTQVLNAFGLSVTSGEKPRAGSVSEKVKELIEAADIFVGVFTRRDRLRGKTEWTTSSWVIDEKAFALANRKKLVLLKEVGVQNIGGIQGDYEYVEFNRKDMGSLSVKLVQLLQSLA